MKRWTLILVALLMVVALSSLGSVVATASKEVGGKGGAPSAETTVRPSKAELEAPRPPRPADFGQMEVRKNGEIVPLREVSAQATSAPQWIDGPASLTHYNNIITGTIGIQTNEWVGYWGATDVSYPKTAELYYGRVVMGNVGTQNTAVVPNVVLPQGTVFDIDPNDPNKRVRCYVWNFKTGETAEFTGADCDQQPSQGLYGALFAPSSSQHNGVWWVPPGWAIVVVFPIYSKIELSGLASGQKACMVGSVFAAGSIEVWDTPAPTDTCPYPSGRGAYQAVFVAFNPPQVQYPNPAATNVTATSARLQATLLSFYDPGTVFFDLGTTTGYGQVDSGLIADTSHTFQLTSDWSNLKPDTTYHWLVRFKDTKGRVFTGPDQSFTTAAGSGDTTKPRVSRTKPAPNATGVAPGANITAVFSEAVRATTVTTTTVTIVKKGSTTPLQATVTYDANAKTALLNPATNLKRGATYKVVVSTGVRDLAGNPLDQDLNKAGNQPKTWTFTVQS